MKRISTVGLLFLGAVLCSGIVVFAEETPRGPEGPPPDGPRHFVRGQTCGMDFHQALQEAYERGFNKGFRAGMKTHGQRAGDYRGPGHQGQRRGEGFERGDFRGDGPRGDFRGPGHQGPRRGEDFDRGRHGPPKKMEPPME